MEIAVEKSAFIHLTRLMDVCRCDCVGMVIVRAWMAMGKFVYHGVCVRAVKLGVIQVSQGLICG